MINFDIKIIIDLIDLPNNIIKKYNIKNIKISDGSPAGNEYEFELPANVFELCISELYGEEWEAHYKNGTFIIYS